MGRGRKPERAPEGFYTTTEAAQRLGVTPTRIRQRIQDGTLPSAPKTLVEDSEGDFTEGRYYIPQDAVDAEAEEKAQEVATHAHVNLSVERVMGVLEGFGEAAEEARRQREDLRKAFDEAREDLKQSIELQDLENQKHLNSIERQIIQNGVELGKKLEKTIEIMEAIAVREREYQDRMIEMLDREAERQRQREGKPERRSLFRRWFDS